jgi:replicative DNA helicase
MLEPIFNEDAETHVLAACLISDTAADRAMEALTPEHFYKLSHEHLFRTMELMTAEGRPLDAITVRSYISEHGIDVPLELVTELASLVPSTSNIAHHAKLVRDAWTKRELQSSIWGLNDKLVEMPANEAVAAYEEASIRLADMVEEKHDSIVDMVTALDYFDKHLANPSESVRGIKVPFSFLDEMIGGRLYILGGYQGHGKTACAMQFAVPPLEDGKDVCIASLEMSEKDLMERWISGLSGVSYRGIQRGDLTVEQRARVDEVTEMMRGWKGKLTILDDEDMTPAKLRRIQRGKKFDLIIVDHLHEMQWNDRKHLEQNVHDLKNMARAFEIPVLLLAQLSRSGNFQNPYPIPTARLLRESGMIDAKAAHIWFVYRERDEDNQFIPHKAKFIVDKNRYGSTYSKQVWFDSNTIGFSETDPDDYELVEDDIAQESVPF